MDSVDYKEYIMKHFMGKTVAFACDCLLRSDVTGVIADAELVGSEIVFSVAADGKIMRIGENTPGLKIRFI